MTERVSTRQVDERAEVVSRGLRGELRVVREGRYGYQALDLYDGEACLRTLSTGLTTRQAYEYLGAMFETLGLPRDGDAEEPRSSDVREPIETSEQDSIVMRVLLLDLPQLDGEHLATIVVAALRLEEEAVS